MSATNRQNRLLLAEDWKRIYQSFKFADFKSYDFDNLRRVMISYLRENYPEDFNDYIESSEYLALIDLIAFLGQNISFRVDLNARENFIELAERRESVLRLARLISYNPKRNRSANGLLKFSSVSTTENIVDSNGRNLSGKTIVWNDSVNPDWFEQFTKIINAALLPQNQFGKPTQSTRVSGIPTEQYRFNSAIQGIPLFSFSKPVNNRNLKFEVVSTGIENNNLVEEAPNPLNQMALVYRDNSQGPGSANTGFFMHFREGTLQQGNFEIENSVPNQKVDIDVSNINQTDVWLYQLNLNGQESDLWNKVDAVQGNNIVFNSLNKKIRNIYSVLTRNNDRISLVFSDGVFGNLPTGNFRAYYRTSSNRNYTILPASISNVTIRIPYISKIGRLENLSITMDLRTAVDNASSSESTESIKSNAPLTYYTQNRLITGEDYNVGPLGVSQDIVKVKSVNRTSSGISRYLDILDATGKYSKTNLFGTDGIIYEEFETRKINFKFQTRTDIEQIIENQILTIVNDKNLRNFYLDQYPNQEFAELNISWSNYSKDTNRSTGLFKDTVVVTQELSTGQKNTQASVYQLSSFTSGPLRFVEIGAMVKFVAPNGKVFNSKNEIVENNNQPGSRNYIWAKVVSIRGAGDTVSNNQGAVVFNEIIPSGAVLDAVKPKFNRTIETSVKRQIIDQIFSYRTFGLRYDVQQRRWLVITNDNLNIFNDFSLAQAGNTSNQQADASWILLFETNGIDYNVSYRTLRYVFESDSEIRFFFDENQKIFDTKTGKIIKDTITALSINQNSTLSNVAYTTDFVWEISNKFSDPAGFVDSKKLEVTFFDSDDDGVIDDPDIFKQLVSDDDLIFTKKVVRSGSQFEEFVDQEKARIWVYDPNFIIQDSSIDNVNRRTTNKIITNFDNNDVIYDRLQDVFHLVNRNQNRFDEIFDYRAYRGRSGIKFQYIHATNDNRRIDPSSTNIIDTYILTRQYDTQYRQFVSGSLNQIPLPPSSDSLFLSYGGEIAKIKSISDEVIYHPVKYKSLFGSKSDLDMQAVFKVVKNPDRVISDNEIKSRVIESIDQYFSLDNWDFGETFYFSELAAFIMKQLSPDLNSIVIVPRAGSASFGSLFEIKSEADEIFISSATVDDVEIITANTADRLKTQGAITSSSNTLNVGIQSAPSTNTINNTGGLTF